MTDKNKLFDFSQDDRSAQQSSTADLQQSTPSSTIRLLHSKSPVSGSTTPTATKSPSPKKTTPLQYNQMMAMVNAGFIHPNQIPAHPTPPSSSTSMPTAQQTSFIPHQQMVAHQHAAYYNTEMQQRRQLEEQLMLANREVARLKYEVVRLKKENALNRREAEAYKGLYDSLKGDHTVIDSNPTPQKERDRAI
ncbi:hypothetical protein GCK72_019434 [Caenorhabditis remanei]|uniref:Uncharacterized protein n=1 Tax=Caenorhabditis remanei TaxID=31234 RepID=A0A6A5GEL1_CAERE|nr:hypothetical protein GCK72_019434 [Caenorhabditis remanei]KAF1752879.1 hypothetical protein GCK72_019434 [Caenorhabditis remanei]